MEAIEFIWFNGKLVPWKEAKIHVLTHSLHYGSAAFEGIRAYSTDKGPAVFRLEEHVNRLFKSFSAFKKEIPFSREQITEAIKETIRANKLEECYIRPLVYHGGDNYDTMGINPTKAPVEVVIATWPWGAYLGKDVLKVKLSKYIRIHPESTVADAKITGHYVNSILSSLDAKEANCDEALLLDYKGYIAEGPGENIFIVKNKKLATPKLGTILPGITRKSVITIAKDLGYETEEKDLALEELLDADEAFFCGTAVEIAGISHVEGKVIGKNENAGKIGEITAQIKKEYLNAVHGKNKKYEKWLTYIR